jgi:hypothetical protein
VPALNHLKRSLAVATTVATAVLGGAMLMTATSASYATPQGNNGTVKIGDQDINDIPNNNPHQGCEFLVEWYGFDAGATSTVNFELQAPTAGAGYSLTATPAIPDTVDLEDDAPGGAGNDFDGSQVYKLDFTGLAQPNQGYHVKLSIDTNDSNGADSKYKVFWVEGCGDTEECETVTVTDYVEVPTTVTETATVRSTKTVTATETVTEPGETQTVTETAPGETQTVTETAPGETQTVTETAPGETVTQTVVNTITLPASTETVTLPGTTATVTQPGETVTVTNTVSVAPSEATSPTDDTSTEPTEATVPTDDTTVAGEQAQQVPSQVAAGSAGTEAPASPVPGGNRTLVLLALLTATLGAGLVGASVAGKRRS